MKLHIATPDGTTFTSDQVESVTLPSTQGEMTILPGHEALFAVLGIGEVEVQIAGETEPSLLAISSGTVEVDGRDGVLVLADTAELARDIDLDRAVAAAELARQAESEAKLMRELSRIRVAKKYRKLDF